MAVKAKKLQPAKTAAIEETKNQFADYNDFIFADYRGMTVEQITNLRKKLREQNATLKVVKNNFARIAFEQMSIDNVADYLKGPTAIAMVKEDSNEVAKTMFDFVKDAPTLSIKGGFIEKEVYDVSKIEAFSKIPGKKTLIAMLMSAINGPARQLAATLQAYVDKKSSGGDTATSAEQVASPSKEDEVATSTEVPAANSDASASAEAPSSSDASGDAPQA